MAENRGGEEKMCPGKLRHTVAVTGTQMAFITESYSSGGSELPCKSKPLHLAAF